MGSDDIFKKRKAAKKQRVFEERLPKADSYLIVAEGEKTEPLYFEALAEKVRTAKGGTIEIKGEGRSTVSLVNKAAEIVSRASNVYTHVWIVFDEDSEKSVFDEAIQCAKNKGFKVAWSNQAFEFWLYLHFYYSDSALSRDQWCDKLNALFKERGIRSEGYEKNLENIYELVTTYGSEQDAIKRASRLQKAFENEKPSKSDPCTTVFQLVEELNGYLDEF